MRCARPFNSDGHASAGSVRLSAVFLVVVSGILGGATWARGESVPPDSWPLIPEPEVVTRFDPPEQRWAAGHRGVDLAAQVGDVVRASRPGTVTFTGAIAGVPIVVVDHGPTRSTYQPVVASARVGAAVAPGAPVGSVAAVGSHCSPQACLHWGLIRNADDTYLDPLAGLRPAPVRLLPWATAHIPSAQVAPLPQAPPTLLRPRVGLFERAP